MVSERSETNRARGGWGLAAHSEDILGHYFYITLSYIFTA